MILWKITARIYFLSLACASKFKMFENSCSEINPISISMFHNQIITFVHEKANGYQKQLLENDTSFIRQLET